MNPTSSPAYQAGMLILCVFALGALAVDAAASDPQIRIILEYTDYALCCVFFADFVISLWLAPDRRRYFVRWGWLDLLSSIPALDIARLGRLARILRVLRVLRGLKAAKLLTSLVFRHKTENTFLAVSVIALLLIVCCSIAILHVEQGPDTNIRTAEDAVWWSFVTITTVGYGDRYPITAEGRFIAAILMCAGVGLFGTFSGFLAAWLVSPDNVARETEITELRDEVRRLRELLERSSRAGVTEPGEPRNDA